MERITERVGDAFKDVWVKNHDYVEAARRLADYEDTGLYPESVEALKLSMMGKAISEITEFDGLPIDRLRELAEADKDGRLVVLPCKVGDTVYMISWRLNGRHEIEERVFSLTYFDPAKYGKDYPLYPDCTDGKMGGRQL